MLEEDLSTEKYIYHVNYEERETDLVALEIRSLFSVKTKRKIFSSNINIKPSLSAFIKHKVHVMFQANDFDHLLLEIKKANIKDEEFLVKYIQHGDETLSFDQRQSACKEIGLNMLGYPSFKAPKIIYGLIYDKCLWSFGLLEENDNEWTKHKSKPNAYSSAINNRVAKAITNIATCGDKTLHLIDPCCGVGTIVIEGIHSGYSIIGRDINEKIAEDARKNLAFFDYTAEITTGSIEDVTHGYDASIVDLPYGILSRFDVEAQNSIIRNAKRISDKIVLISSENIRKRIEKEGLKVIDHCEIVKSVNRQFSRYVWVCTKV